MSRQFLLCMAAACCCCLALLVLPVQGGRVGAAAGLVGGRDHRLLFEPRFHVVVVAEPKEPQRGVTVKARSSSWLPTPAAAAGRGRSSELRAVPGGPDPMHHHGSPRRPERATP